MLVKNYNHGKFFGPVQSYSGYVFIACGILFVSYSFLTLFLIIPGAFMAFTSTGTILDTDNKKVKPFTLLFGFFSTGKWIDVKEFTRFSIQKGTRRYTSYSRGSVKLDLGITDIRLMLVNSNGTGKIIVNRYSNFEEAHLEMEELNRILFPARCINREIQLLE
jgi:hypothetical protein